MNDEIKIPINKSKGILVLLGSIAFVFFGIWFTINPERFSNTIYRPRSAEFIFIVGIISIVFFGICGVYIFKKLFDKKYGLIINKIGINDNSNGTSIGLIKWTDIIGLRVVQEYSQKFIIVDVSNPEYYINLKKSRIGKSIIKSNYNKYGSPIGITTSTLKIDFAELKEIIEKQYEKNAPQHCV